MIFIFLLYCLCYLYLFYFNEILISRIILVSGSSKPRGCTTTKFFLCFSENAFFFWIGRSFALNLL